MIFAMKTYHYKCNIRHSLQIKTMTQTQTPVLDLLIVDKLFTHSDKVFTTLQPDELCQALWERPLHTEW